jgi:hypothetical protein
MMRVVLAAPMPILPSRRLRCRSDAGDVLVAKKLYARTPSRAQIFDRAGFHNNGVELIE